MADDGDRRAKKALLILDDFEKALTTILIGNNIMHIGCSSAATLLVTKLYGNAAVAGATFVTTFVIFLFAEMIPKAYAKDCSEKLVPKLASSLLFLIKILTPISFVFSGISVALNKLMGGKNEEEPTVTQEEFEDIIENIDEEDNIDEDTAELVQSAYEFTGKTIEDIYVPWEKVVCIPADIEDDELMELVLQNHYSRMPVLNSDGEAIGIMQIRRILRAKLRGKPNLKPHAAMDPVNYVRASKPIDEALEKLSALHCHMALVRDAEKNVIGMVTVEDILEELVGEIYDEEEKGGSTQC